MFVQHVNSKQFEQLVAEGRTVLVDFYADWCGPCRMLTPVMEEIAAERPEITVCKINVDEEMELAGQFRVYSIPTLAVMKDGQMVQQAVGARPKHQILGMF